MIVFMQKEKRELQKVSKKSEVLHLQKANGTYKR